MSLVDLMDSRIVDPISIKRRRSAFNWMTDLHKDWRRPTLPPRSAVPSALRSLTTLFGMGRGDPPRCSHQYSFEFNFFDFRQVRCSLISCVKQLILLFLLLLLNHLTLNIIESNKTRSSKRHKSKIENLNTLHLIWKKNGSIRVISTTRLHTSLYFHL